MSARPVRPMGIRYKIRTNEEETRISDVYLIFSGFPLAALGVFLSESRVLRWIGRSGRAVGFIFS